jgi:hypothetical protein
VSGVLAGQGPEVPFSSFINEIPKCVVSNTLKDAAWNITTTHPLRLLRHETFKSGVLDLTYAPDRSA